MLKKFEDVQQGSLFSLTTIDRLEECLVDKSFKIIWCTEGTLQLKVDYEPVEVRSGQILCLAPTQFMEVASSAKGFVYQYNRPFYCILDHDMEISCVGLLYYGSLPTTIIKLDQEQSRKVELLLEVFLDEFDTKDNIQEEMLRMLLKRLIILCTRWFKDQSGVTYKEEELDLIRQFHVLIEQHFREKQTIQEYADLLNKSPKTLSNVFSKNQEKTPLRQIHERIALEAKRLLLFTDKSIKEIGWELNFDEESHFSRFFKRLIGHPPSKFRSLIKQNGKNW